MWHYWARSIVTFYHIITVRIASVLVVPGSTMIDPTKTIILFFNVYGQGGERCLAFQPRK